MRAGVPNLAEQLALWTNANFSFDGPTGHALLGEEEEKDKDKDEADAAKDKGGPKSFGFNNPNHRLEEASGRPLGGPAQPLPGPSRQYAGAGGSGSNNASGSGNLDSHRGSNTHNDNNSHQNPGLANGSRPSPAQTIPTPLTPHIAQQGGQQGLASAATSMPPPSSAPGGFAGLGFGGLAGLGGPVPQTPSSAALGSLPFLFNTDPAAAARLGAGQAGLGTSPPALDMTSILALQHLLASNPLALAQLSSSLASINPLLAQMQLAQAQQQQQQQQ